MSVEGLLRRLGLDVVLSEGQLQGRQWRGAGADWSTVRVDTVLDAAASVAEGRGRSFIAIAAFNKPRKDACSTCRWNPALGAADR